MLLSPVIATTNRYGVLIKALQKQGKIIPFDRVFCFTLKELTLVPMSVPIKVEPLNEITYTITRLPFQFPFDFFVIVSSQRSSFINLTLGEWNRNILYIYRL